MAHWNWQSNAQKETYKAKFGSVYSFILLKILPREQRSVLKKQRVSRALVAIWRNMEAKLGNRKIEKKEQSALITQTGNDSQWDIWMDCNGSNQVVICISFHAKGRGKNQQIYLVLLLIWAPFPFLFPLLYLFPFTFALDSLTATLNSMKSHLPRYFLTNACVWSPTPLIGISGIKEPPADLWQHGEKSKTSSDHLSSRRWAKIMMTDSLFLNGT